MEEEKRYSYGKINHFTDIEAWKLARKLRVEIYKIVKEFPPEEKFDWNEGRCESAGKSRHGVGGESSGD